jgi:hypothetical protein
MVSDDWVARVVYDRWLVEKHLPIAELPVAKNHHNHRSIKQDPKCSIILPVVEMWGLPVKISELHFLDHVLDEYRE